MCHLPCAERVADLVVDAGVDVLEGRILQLLLQTPQAQSIGQGGVDVQCLTADLHLLQLPRKREKGGGCGRGAGVGRGRLRPTGESGDGRMGVHVVSWGG